METRTAGGLDASIEAAAALSTVARTWLSSLDHAPGGEGQGIGRALDRPDLVPSDVQGHFRALLSVAVDAFAAGTACADARTMFGQVSTYRFLAETLILTRWLSEPTDLVEREARGTGLLQAAMRRLQRAADLGVEDEGLADQHALMGQLRGLLEDRLQASPHLVPIAVPNRPDLFRRYLPGGRAVFNAVSELGAHPSPLARAILRSDDPDRDALFWLSASFGTLVSIMGEIAFGLGREAWIDEVLAIADASSSSLGGAAMSRQLSDRPYFGHRE